MWVTSSAWRSKVDISGKPPWLDNAASPCSFQAQHIKLLSNGKLLNGDDCRRPRYESTKNRNIMPLAGNAHGRSFLCALGFLVLPAYDFCSSWRRGFYPAKVRRWPWREWLSRFLHWARHRPFPSGKLSPPRAQNRRPKSAAVKRISERKNRNSAAVNRPALRSTEYAMVLCSPLMLGMIKVFSPASSITCRQRIQIFGSPQTR